MIAINSNATISDATKSTIEHLKTGSDKRTVRDTLALAQLGLKSNNQEIFNESMSQASPEARAQFLQADGIKDIQEKLVGWIANNAQQLSRSR